MVACDDDSAVLDAMAFRSFDGNRLSILVTGYTLPTGTGTNPVWITVNGFTPRAVSATRLYAPNGDVYANTPATIETLSPNITGVYSNKVLLYINKRSQFEILKIDLTP
jgi:hypothetical protein